MLDRRSQACHRREPRSARTRSMLSSYPCRRRLHARQIVESDTHLQSGHGRCAHSHQRRAAFLHADVPVAAEGIALCLDVRARVELRSSAPFCPRSRPSMPFRRPRTAGWRCRGRRRCARRAGGRAGGAASSLPEVGARPTVEVILGRGSVRHPVCDFDRSRVSLLVLLV